MKFIRPEFEDPMAHPKAARREMAARQKAFWEDWAAHNDHIRPLLPEGLAWLLDFSLDDAIVLSLTINTPQKSVQLVLLAGDRQRGYFELHLSYGNVALINAEVQLLCLIVHAADDIYWGEIDIDPNGNFIHRILWHSSIQTGGDASVIHTLEPEIELSFGSFALKIVENANLNKKRAKQFITLLSPETPTGRQYLL
jgi:hypothetical protein